MKKLIAALVFLSLAALPVSSQAPLPKDEAIHNELRTLRDGRMLDLPARWSATLVKDGDKWLIVSLHASDDLFDNPLLAIAKRTAYWAGGVALVVGLIAGFAIGRRRTEA